MSAFKIQAGPEFNTKAKAAGHAALGLWTVCASWSVKNDTNGEIPDYVLRHLGGSRRLAKRLVDSGLWGATADGWKFPEWRKATDGDYRRNIRKSVRAAVMERDGNQCIACGSADQLSLDHIIRYRDGGPDTIENLRVLCMPCNLERG